MGAMFAAAVAGQGGLMAADWLVTHELAAGRLASLLPGGDAEGEDDAHLVGSSREHAPLKTQAFCHWPIREF